MNFVITENMLHNTVFKFLDTFNFYIFDNGKKFHGYIYFLEKKDDDIAKISVYTRNGFGLERNLVFINESLITNVSDFFSIDDDTTIKFIEAWVANKLNIVPNTPDKVDYSHRFRVKI